MKNSKFPIIDAISGYIKKNKIRLHMPGHKGKPIAPEFNIIEPSVYNIDLTEVSGLDNLHYPLGVIEQAEELMAELFEAECSFLLINGATAGIHASFLALAQPQKKVFIPRNSHQAVFSALVLTGLEPVYLPVELCSESGMPLGVREASLKNLKKTHNESLAFAFNVRPSYEGITAPLLDELCDIQVVDEAHGGHFMLSDKLPDTALQCGGDFVVNGTHKTLGSLTQTGLLHIADNKYQRRVRQALAMVQSTSPSYILMASLDIMRHNVEARGYKLMEDCLEVAMYIRKELEKIEGFFCIQAEDVAPKQLDYTKITFGYRHLSGFYLAKILCDDYGIEVEMAASKYVVAMITINDNHETGKVLLSALKDIKKRHRDEFHKSIPVMPFFEIPQLEISPRRAYFALKKTVKLEEAQGLICGEALCLYPPGIPLICPGEIISYEIIDYIKIMQREGVSWHGCFDTSLKTIQVVADNA